MEHSLLLIFSINYFVKLNERTFKMDLIYRGWLASMHIVSYNPAKVCSDQEAVTSSLLPGVLCKMLALWQNSVQRNKIITNWEKTLNP